MDKQLSYQAPSSDSAPLSQVSIQAGSWKDFINVIKPGILRSNLIAAFGGFWLASKWDINFVSLVWMLLGTTLVMASSCAFNNYYDREMDMKMTRTRDRALPTGRLTPTVVLWYSIILGVLGLAVLFVFTNVLAGVLGLVGMLVYGGIYTLWLKRTSTWSTSVGAISGAMPPVIGYVAVTNAIDMGAILLFALLFLWQPPHFWALGIRRVEEYRAAGFPLLPVVKGIRRTKFQMIPYVALLVLVSVLFYVYGYVGWIFLCVATLLSAAWLFMTFSGFKAKVDEIWAKKHFFMSINYLMVVFFIMIIDTAHK
ncbi:heme o synthase [Paenibacillus guangzhouensis]|uniref:heme o synthase n=1 Tax=Paenibacillus guangzhouensis TaxID=1473112 RepID=UPI001267622B|nr:heme o synthase [Paenibacillus guangzhouensis]